MSRSKSVARSSSRESAAKRKRQCGIDAKSARLTRSSATHPGNEERLEGQSAVMFKEEQLELDEYNATQYIWMWTDGRESERASMLSHGFLYTARTLQSGRKQTLLQLEEWNVSRSNK